MADTSERASERNENPHTRAEHACVEWIQVTIGWIKSTDCIPSEKQPGRFRESDAVLFIDSGSMASRRRSVATNAQNTCSRMHFWWLLAFETDDRLFRLLRFIKMDMRRE